MSGNPQDRDAPAEPIAPVTNVENAETVNVAAPADTRIPHVWVLASVTACVLLGFAAVTFWVLAGEPGRGIDAATKGALIQTWNNLALLAAGFWLGSSMAGKIATKSPTQ